MRLVASEALRQEWRVYEKYRRRVFIFPCQNGCGREIAIQASHGRKVTGLCRHCAMKVVSPVKSWLEWTEGSRIGQGCVMGNGQQSQPFEALFRRMKLTAGKRGIDFSLAFQDFLVFTQQKECTYCGYPVYWKPYGPSCYNLDRKDNAAGYVLPNLAVCCKVCNRVKSDEFSYEEMLLIAPVLRQILAARSS